MGFTKPTQHERIECSDLAVGEFCGNGDRLRTNEKWGLRDLGTQLTQGTRQSVRPEPVEG